MLNNLSSQNSIIAQFVADLRSVDKQSERLRFRSNTERIGSCIAYELSKQLQYRAVEIETPLGIANCEELADEVVVLSILRAGLPLQNGILHILPNAEVGFVASYRMHHKDGSFDIHSNYATFPNLNGKVVILADSMIATGASVHDALEVINEEYQPKAVHVVSVIASAQGIAHLERHYDNLVIWTAAIDDELTAKSYIVPGLGDAGDLSYGPKRQE